MSVSKLNLSIDQGTDYYLQAEYLDYLTNLPRDLSGYSAVLDIKDSYDDPNPLLTLSSNTGEILLGGAQGGITCHFTPAMTNPSTQVSYWTQGVYNLVLTDANNVVTKLLTGFISITPTA